MLRSVPQHQLESSAKPPPLHSRQSKAAGHTPRHPSWWLQAGEFLQHWEKRPSTSQGAWDKRAPVRRRKQ